MLKNACAIAFLLTLSSAAPVIPQQEPRPTDPDYAPFLEAPPTSCREVLAVALIQKGHPFNPRAFNIVEATMADTADENFSDVLDYRLVFDFPSRVARSQFASDAVEAISEARDHVLCLES
jgi:hypothetical protein